MKKIYTLLFILSLISCSTKVQYVGSKFSPGKNLDVYVTESSIKKTYTIMGQGFIKTGYLNKINWDKVQKQSVKKGKSNATIGTLCKIAELLEVPIQKLFDWE